MPEMKHLNHVRLLADPIINQDGRVDKPTHPRHPRYRTPNVREPPQQIDVIEKRVREALSRLRKSRPGVFNDLLKLG